MTPLNVWQNSWWFYEEFWIFEKTFLCFYLSLFFSNTVDFYLGCYKCHNMYINIDIHMGSGNADTLFYLTFRRCFHPRWSGAVHEVKYPKSFKAFRIYM